MSYLFFWGGDVITGVLSHFKNETKMTGEDTARNHKLLLKIFFDIEGNTFLRYTA